MHLILEHRQIVKLKSDTCFEIINGLIYYVYLQINNKSLKFKAISDIDQIHCIMFSTFLFRSIYNNKNKHF